jgi:hypothetical protein
MDKLLGRSRSLPAQAIGGNATDVRGDVANLEDFDRLYETVGGERTHQHRFRQRRRS